MAQPITFTPFASARPCSARCVFCSETLVHRAVRLLSASLRPQPDYKLIYHANGNLCGDWDPERDVLMTTRGAA